MVQTDLIGKYVSIPDDGDAGWIRAVYVASNSLFVFVQRDNSSRDFKSYFASQIMPAKQPKPKPVGP